MAKDVLASGVGWLNTFLNENVSEDVELIQDGATYPIQVTVAGENNDAETDFGVIINTRQQDFLVDENELTVHGLVGINRGDIIKRTVGDKSISYEVSGDGSEQASRYMSRYRNRLRVHTNRTNWELIPPP